MNMMVSIDNVIKKFDEKNVLNNISINIPQGSICGLVGPNGAGKTTLLRIISSLQEADSGQAKINASVYSALIEKPALLNELDAYENITQQLIIYGLEDKYQPSEFLEYVGLEDILNKKVKHFSLGMKQKLAIAMMLVGNPDLIILDEPMNGLDPQGMIDLRNLILKLNEDGVTFIISSHLLYELEKIATDFIFINHGEIIANMTSEEFKDIRKGYIQLEIDNKDSFIKTMEDLRMDYVQVDDNKLNVFTNISITDLIIILNDHGCTVKRCFNIETDLEEFFIRLMGGNDE